MNGVCSNMDTFDSVIYIGVDEAGRGPVLGDLVIGLVAIDNQQYSYLKNIGIRDSKELSSLQREYLLNFIRENSILLETIYIPPVIVDRFKLNRLLARLVISTTNNVLNIIRVFYNENTIVKVFIDEITGYSDFIKTMIDKKVFRDIDIVIDANADKKYLAVSAASIVAKYFRDKNLYLSKKIYGEFGSGYPVDRRTRSWIEEYYRIYKDPPLIIRRSWATLSILAPKWYSDLKHGKSILNYVKR